MVVDCPPHWTDESRSSRPPRFEVEVRQRDEGAVSLGEVNGLGSSRPLVHLLWRPISPPPRQFPPSRPANPWRRDRAETQTDRILYPRRPFLFPFTSSEYGSGRLSAWASTIKLARRQRRGHVHVPRPARSSHRVRVGPLVPSDGRSRSNKLSTGNDVGIWLPGPPAFGAGLKDLEPVPRLHRDSHYPATTSPRSVVPRFSRTHAPGAFRDLKVHVTFRPCA